METLLRVCEHTEGYEILVRKAINVYKGTEQ